MIGERAGGAAAVRPGTALRQALSALAHEKQRSSSRSIEESDLATISDQQALSDVKQLLSGRCSLFSSDNGRSPRFVHRAFEEYLAAEHAWGIVGVGQPLPELLGQGGASCRSTATACFFGALAAERPPLSSERFAKLLREGLGAVLRRAVLAGDELAVRGLLALTPDRMALLLDEDQHGQTAVHLAALAGHGAVAGALVELAPRPEALLTSCGGHSRSMPLLPRSSSSQMLTFPGDKRAVDVDLSRTRGDMGQGAPRSNGSMFRNRSHGSLPSNGYVTSSPLEPLCLESSGRFLRALDSCTGTIAYRARALSRTPSVDELTLTSAVSSLHAPVLPAGDVQSYNVPPPLASRTSTEEFTAPLASTAQSRPSIKSVELEKHLDAHAIHTSKGPPSVDGPTHLLYAQAFEGSRPLPRAGDIERGVAKPQIRTLSRPPSSEWVVPPAPVVTQSQRLFRTSAPEKTPSNEVFHTGVAATHHLVGPRVSPAPITVLQPSRLSASPERDCSS